MINKFGVVELLLLRNHVILNGTLFPGLPEVVGARKQGMLDGLSSVEQAKCSEQRCRRAETRLHDLNRLLARF